MKNRYFPTLCQLTEETFSGILITQTKYIEFGFRFCKSVHGAPSAVLCNTGRKNRKKHLDKLGLIY